MTLTKRVEKLEQIVRLLIASREQQVRDAEATLLFMLQGKPHTKKA
jgi:hypothetical protein